MKVFFLSLVFIGIALVSIPGLIRNKQRGELFISSILLGAGFVLSLLQVVGVKLPNPNKGIQFLIKLVFS